MEILGREISLGADPELFVEKGNGPKSAYNLVPGTKAKPYPVPLGAVQVDGMALEFNIDPAKTKEEFVNNIVSVQNTLAKMVKGYSIYKNVTANFSEDYIKEQNPESLILGCEPDYDAYTMDTNMPPNPSNPFRTAGGHIHVGGYLNGGYGTVQGLYEASRMSRLLDRELGVYSVLWDGDNKRREMYGSAGAFRCKSFGMEYRTMSNSWIFKDSLIELVYEFSMDAVRYYLKGEDISTDICRTIIDNSDRSNSFFNGPKSERVKEVLNGT